MSTETVRNTPEYWMVFFNIQSKSQLRGVITAGIQLLIQESIAGFTGEVFSRHIRANYQAIASAQRKKHYKLVGKEYYISGELQDKIKQQISDLL